MHADSDIKSYWYISWNWVVAGVFLTGLAAGAVLF